MTDQRKGPVLIDLGDDAPARAEGAGRDPAQVLPGSDDPLHSPATAPPVPDVTLPRSPAAMETAARLVARRGSPLWRWFWQAVVALVGFFVSLATYQAIVALLAANPILGGIATGLVALVLILLLAISVRELSAFSRLARVDRLRAAADQALADQDLRAARAVTDQLARFYRGRADTEWGRQRLADKRDEVMDADATLHLAEDTLLAPLDDLAVKEVEAAARQVALVTALVPLALADVISALTANLRMIRRIAEIYGGRSGSLGVWRLTRAVLTHLVATGAVAIGDDLIGTIMGGSVLSKVSRRFGEGVVNGALTARVGIAALEVCRPLPFGPDRKPSLARVAKRALSGVFSSGSAE